MNKVIESNILLSQNRLGFDNGSILDQLVLVDAPLPNLNTYQRDGGYQALEKALSTSPEVVISEVVQSGLIGRGGAGYPTGKKWEIVNKISADQKYFICNAEEGEPGTFKDRVLLEQNPHQVLEGIILGAYAVGASVGYIYINGEFQRGIQIFQKAIHDAQDAGYLGDKIRGSSFSFHLKLFRSMGAYICGEETALINSIEGRRGVPRTKPPYPTECGLFQKPTVVNNVETLANIPSIILCGGDRYRELGVEGSRGTKLISISGNVRKPGVYEVELGKYTVGELLYGLAEGINGDKKVKAILPGGASTCFLTDKHLDVLMDYRSISAVGSSLGTGGMIVFDEEQSIPGIVKRLFDFYKRESCGVCVPCRLGTDKVHDILCLITEPVTLETFRAYYTVDSPVAKRPLGQLRDMAVLLRQLSRCGLGQSASDPLWSSLSLFEDEYVALIEERQKEYEVLSRRFRRAYI